MIEKVQVKPGCISCRNCENIAPEIFKVAPKSKVITDNYNGQTTEIIQAELLCPVNVIQVKKTGNINISLQEARLIKKIQLTWDVVELVFSTNNFQAKPWQYISLQMSDWKWFFYRNYSITDFNSNNFSLTIKLLEDWRWSKYIKKLKLNKKLKFLWWIWTFILQNNQRKKVFFATNTGISPIVSMLKNIPWEIDKQVYFWVRSKKDIFYSDLIQSFNNTNLDISISHTEETANWNTQWRITEKVYEVNKESEVYICWNPNMMDEVIEKLIAQWHPKELIFSEWFVMWKEERSVWKNIILKWNIPCIGYIDKFLPPIWLIWIPLLYFYGVNNNKLYSSWFLWDQSISSLLFLVSWYAVVFVMFIRPLADLFPKLWFLRKLSILRKAIGIVWSTVIVIIFLDNYVIDYSNFTNYFSQSKWTWMNTILSRLTEITWIILLITSNNFSQQKLWKYWKIIQRSSYIYFISWWMVAAYWWTYNYYYIISIWWILFIAAAVKNKFFTK